MSCDLLKLFLVHGLRQELRESLSEKQRSEGFAFQCQVLARNIATAHVHGFAKDQEYRQQRAAQERA